MDPPVEFVPPPGGTKSPNFTVFVPLPKLDFFHGLGVKNFSQHRCAHVFLRDKTLETPPSSC
jgi:hypothetical protein